MNILKGFEFKHGESIIHKLDPRAKLLFSIVLLIISFIFFNPLILLLIFLSLLPLFYTSNVLGDFLKTLRGSLFFIILVFVINFLTLDFIYALSLSLRLILIISCFSIFFLTTYPEDFAEALIKLKVPYDFALTFTMALRFVPTLAREAQLIIDAQRSRGLEIEKGSFIVRLKNYIPILVPLIVGAVRRSIKVAEAMESRAFGASPKRSSIVEFSFKKNDYLFIFLTISLLLFSLWLKYYLHLDDILNSYFQFGQFHPFL
ncbi:MAG: energy-coupling factor transporter transmembrane protein EcfT [Candidatus Verstraetearchaeota archaeon]|nr:energy-coupling factor transporter transmembrane protein EcfT [Candidatus Verstraetearchaeota archaeon]